LNPIEKVGERKREGEKKEEGRGQEKDRAESFCKRVYLKPARAESEGEGEVEGGNLPRISGVRERKDSRRMKEKKRNSLPRKCPNLANRESLSSLFEGSTTRGNAGEEG